MTPEERAEKIMERGHFWSVLENDITAAIRAAENDALERAALECDKADENEYPEEPGGSAASAAIAIRALKHKEAT
jgi:hypothetical protein